MKKMQTLTDAIPLINKQLAFARNVVTRTIPGARSSFLSQEDSAADLIRVTFIAETDTHVYEGRCELTLQQCEKLAGLGWHKHLYDPFHSLTKEAVVRFRSV